MSNTIKTRIKLRTDTLANWNLAANSEKVKIYRGEAALGLDTENNKYIIKIGTDAQNGSYWKNLSENLTIPAENVIGLSDTQYEYQLTSFTSDSTNDNGSFKLQKKLPNDVSWTDVATVTLKFTGDYNPSENPIALKDYVDASVGNATTSYWEGVRGLKFEGTENERAETDTEVIERVLTGVANVKGGSTFVIKTLIPGTGDKYERIAFTYDTTTNPSTPIWKAMDGNYNAKNVYLDEKIVYTTNVGTLNSISGSTTKADFNCAGMSVYEALKEILSKTVNPTVTNPNYTLAIGTITTSEGNKSTGNNIEIGSTVTKVAWNGTYTDGSYSYKSQEAPTATAAGCTASYTMTNDKNATATSTTTEDGTFTLPNAVTIVSGSNTLIKIDGTCTYSASPRTPYNNIQETVPSLKISSGSISKSATATLNGYYNDIFFGGITSQRYTAAQLAENGSLLRSALSAVNVSGYSSYTSNTKNGSGSKITTFKFVAPSGTKTIVIAAKGSRTLNGAFNDSVFAEMKPSFIQDTATVTIPGAGSDAGTTYTIWTYSPADAYSSQVKLSVTL